MKHKEQLALFEQGEPARFEPPKIVTHGARVGLTPGAERLLANFELLADAPGGIKRLRDLILTLAVRAKLVPQDEHDKSGKALLEKSARLKPSDTSRGNGAIMLMEPPAALPDSWAWTSVESVCSFVVDGDHNPPARVVAGIPHVTAKNVRSGRIDYDGCTFIAPETFEKIRRRYSPQPGDVLLTCVGTLGRTALVCDEVFSADRNIAALRPIRLVCDGRFLEIVLNGPEMQGLIAGSSESTAQPHIYLNDLRSLPCPVPPLAEQTRIVAKVDELMKVCDDLEARQARQRETAARLNKAALEALTSAEGPEELASSWQRVADNFDALVEDPELVAEVRGTILGLGLRGHLTRLWRSTRECEGLRAADSTQAPLPASWEWSSVGALCSTVTSGSRGWKEYYAERGAVFVRSQDIKTDALDLTTPAYVAIPKNAEGTRTRIQRDDLLITITGANVGKAAHVRAEPPEAYVSQHVALVRLKEPALAPWVHRWLISPSNGGGRLLGFSYGDKPGLNLGNIRSLPIALPSVEEQRTIIAEMDRLLALCDTLKAKLRRAEDTAVKLADALVAELLA
jgi:type I restriction enzyme S subunit